MITFTLSKYSRYTLPAKPLAAPPGDPCVIVIRFCSGNGSTGCEERLIQGNSEREVVREDNVTVWSYTERERGETKAWIVSEREVFIVM